MAEAKDHSPHPGNDDELARAVADILGGLDDEGKLAVLEFSQNLKKEHTRPNLAAVRLLDEWMEDDSGYDEEAWPELKEALDRDRLSNRKLFG